MYGLRQVKKVNCIDSDSKWNFLLHDLGKFLTAAKS